MSRLLMLASATATAAGYTTIQVLGRRAGSSAHERAARLPGDELVHYPQLVMNHGVTIEGRAEEIWPRLTQMGWQLGGYYTPHWVDKLLFPARFDRSDASGAPGSAASSRLGAAAYAVLHSVPPRR